MTKTLRNFLLEMDSSLSNKTGFLIWTGFPVKIFILKFISNASKNSPTMVGVNFKWIVLNFENETNSSQNWLTCANFHSWISFYLAQKTFRLWKWGCFFEALETNMNTKNFVRELVQIMKPVSFLSLRFIFREKLCSIFVKVLVKNLNWELCASKQV